MDLLLIVLSTPTQLMAVFDVWMCLSVWVDSCACVRVCLWKTLSNFDNHSISTITQSGVYESK